MGFIESARWNLILGVAETVVFTLCTWYFVSRTGTVKEKRRPQRISAFLFYWVIHTLITFYMANTEYGGFILLVFDIAAAVMISHFLYGGQKIVLFYCFLFQISIFITQIMVYYIIFSYSMARWGSTVFDYYTANVAVIVTLLSIILLTAVWVLLLNRRKYADIPGIHFAGLFIPPVFTIFIIGSLIVLGNIYTQMYGALLIVINISLLIIMNLYMLYLFSYLSKNRKLKNELELFRRQSQMQYQYYENIEKKYQSSRKLVHDMRNHMQALETLSHIREDSAANAYAKDIHHILDSLGLAVYTDNRMLNIVLNDKAEAAAEKGVDMNIQVGDINLSWIKDMDITTIFANLLDNALEAAECADHGYVDIKAAVFHNFIVIKIQNSVGDKTQKKAGEHMGIGLENVRMTLAKYGGGMQVEETDSDYKVSITIPMAEDTFAQ